eukprot:TRINITY_DN18821_c0_g1_i1.p1 TRINITY_DN18821_c0_g1~~TRINITY_DN18821_c0_g1_i1.p1  ORF type:complete len:342 (+),score=27.96 TRINITY_DN18821_c0_g1_i1:103-1026(+)
MTRTQFQNSQFKHEILKIIKKKRNQKKLYKLRSMNKALQQQSEHLINSATTSIENLQSLANSNFNAQIKNLKILIPENKKFLDDLRFATPEYFNKIKKINIKFTKDDFNSDKNVKIIQINKPTFFRGLTIECDPKNDTEIQFTGNFSLKITNSTFVGVQITANQNKEVQIKRSNFYKSPNNGFYCQNCDSLILQDVYIKQSNVDGCYVENCQNVRTDNVEIVSCGASACVVSWVPNFQIENVNIWQCQEGIWFFDSYGKIKNCLVRNCRNYGIDVSCSMVKYDDIVCTGNGKQQINVDIDSQYVQGV